ncbi:Diadenosine 5',5'''-P1,P4-tetraphosphate phosphorylase 2 [Colletotrichum sp. SAR 10_86]|nr:Diadenosine 5',5'''-P1,P4-tetraphosphate phosphorylase 2 [Colletotrichum sp. SAR 10_76]KAI8235380.1 Diadenosine 5',5'''-P1,P4-tetraphosphate phosphorylase 2 [Colletotrichum sp. SAR 10_86]
MAPIKAPANLPELVKTAFNKARANGDLNYYATQVAVLTANSIPVSLPQMAITLSRAAPDTDMQFQLRFSPALANKPTAPRSQTDQPRKPFDPFENPENGPLFIAAIPSSGHNLVLNKFAIVPEHFILATKDYKLQTHLLEPNDLAATYACIEAYRQHGDNELYAFFNSGQHSGASQPHRHIQLLPVAQMKDGLPEGSRWDVLAKQLVQPQLMGIPFTTFGEKIHGGMTPNELHAVYVSLFRSAVDAVEAHVGKLDDSGNGEARISYNLAMTSNSLVVMPRLAEGHTIEENGRSVGKLSLNGTVLAGTALVKSEAEWSALKANSDSNQLVDILAKIGIPKNPGHSKKL